MLSVFRHLLGQKAANQDILSPSDCLSIFMPFNTDEAKPDLIKSVNSVVLCFLSIVKIQQNYNGIL